MLTALIPGSCSRTRPPCCVVRSVSIASWAGCRARRCRCSVRRRPRQARLRHLRARVAGALPLVVMPHGGPESRDTVDFDAMAQAFAAQGWLVLQPNFRGSSGYGRRFAEAGHRHWAKRMQDDVTDAVDDLVKHGIADRQRIVIYGASY